MSDDSARGHTTPAEDYSDEEIAAHKSANITMLVQTPDGTLRRYEDRQPAVRLVLPFPPSANRYWRTMVKNGCVLTYLSEEAKAYREEVADFVLEQLDRRLWANIHSQNLDVELAVYFPVPQDGDLGNREKVLADALAAATGHDDQAHWYIALERRYDALCPRVNVRLTAHRRERLEDDDLYPRCPLNDHERAARMKKLLLEQKRAARRAQVAARQALTREEAIETPKRRARPK